MRFPLEVIVGLLSITLALVMTPLVRLAAFQWGFVDRPTNRSSHEKATARGGGVVIVLSLLAASIISRPIWTSQPGDSHIAFLLGGVIIAAIGLCDDRLGLSPLPRFLCQTSVAFVFISMTEGLDRLPFPSPLDLSLGFLNRPIAVVWIVAVINFYNFLDGIDGLAALQGIITGFALAWAAWDPFATIVGIAVASGCMGFLVFNWSPARIFLGDVGSGFLGYTFAALPFLAPVASRPKAILFMGLSLWLFLADATWTLIRRTLTGRRWYEAHREHLYQRLVASGWSHGRVTITIGMGSLGLSVLALLIWQRNDVIWGWASLVAALILFSLELKIVQFWESK